MEPGRRFRYLYLAKRSARGPRRYGFAIRAAGSLVSELSRSQQARDSLRPEEVPAEGHSHIPDGAVGLVGRPGPGVSHSVGGVDAPDRSTGQEFQGVLVAGAEGSTRVVGRPRLGRNARWARQREQPAVDRTVRQECTGEPCSPPLSERFGPSLPETTDLAPRESLLRAPLVEAYLPLFVRVGLRASRFFYARQVCSSERFSALG